MTYMIIKLDNLKVSFLLHCYIK